MPTAASTVPNFSCYGPARIYLQMAAPISRAPPIPKGKQTVIKGPWTEEEDAKVRQLVMELGTKKWCVLCALICLRVCSPLFTQTSSGHLVVHG